VELALSDSEKAEAVADCLEAQFQPVSVHSIPAVIDKVGVALESYFQIPTKESHFTDPGKVQVAHTGLKVGKAPGPNGVPNRALKNFLMRMLTSFVVLSTNHFPEVWKHPRVISILKQGKSYRLFDTIGKVKTTQRIGLLVPILNRSEPLMDYGWPVWRSAARRRIRRLQVLYPCVFALLRVSRCTFVTGRFTEIWVFHSSPTTSQL
jgi:hypothetical protein